MKKTLILFRNVITKHLMRLIRAEEPKCPVLEVEIIAGYYLYAITPIFNYLLKPYAAINNCVWLSLFINPKKII